MPVLLAIYFRLVGNPSVTLPNGQRRVRYGLPVVRRRIQSTIRLEPKPCPVEPETLYFTNRPRSFLWVSLILRHMKFNGTG
jgi:hypothetical protein